MPDVIHPADLAACRTLLRGGSRSFYAASRLLPRRVMEPATGLYAFCRVADDLIDGTGGQGSHGGMGQGTQGAGGEGALEVLHRRLDRVYAGQPADHAADRALAAVVARHRMPRVLLDGLLEGFAWDAAGRQYDDLDALQTYAARVAGTVGGMMAVLMGVRSADVVARACDLGIAMQLSNIARDVGEDARAGRLYLPRRWLAEAGVDPEGFLAAPAYTPALGTVVARLVHAADRLYARADAGIAALPLDCRTGIGAARRLYAAIGHKVVRAGGNSVDGRAVVGLPGKFAAVGRAAGAVLLAGGPVTAAALPASRHLVAAIAASPAPLPSPRGLVWLIELFAELDSRQAVASRSAP